MARKFKAMPSIPYCKGDSARESCPRAAEENPSTLPPLQHRLLGEHGDHLVAFRGHHPLPRVLLAVDLIFHEEMSFLLEVGAAVTAHVALRVTLLVPNLHKHPYNARSTLVTHGQLLGIPNRCSHLCGGSLDAPKSRWFAGISWGWKESASEHVRCVASGSSPKQMLC